MRVGAFLTGLCGSYVLLGIAAGTLAWFASHSSISYAALSAVAAVAGTRTILRPRELSGCSRHAAVPEVQTPYGAALLAGSGFATIASPCCGPLALGLAGLSSAASDRACAMLVLAAFSIGQALPLIVFACGCGRLRLVTERCPPAALATIGGAVMLALSAYYGLLA